jgi:flagellar protein FlgJ
MSNDPLAVSNAATTQGLAVDGNNLSALKGAAAQNTPAAIKETAKQFEALFVGMMLKSMRKATPSDGPMDSEQGKMFTSMLDEQISQKIAQRGLGLADMLEKQMMSNAGLQYTPKGAASGVTNGATGGAAKSAQSGAGAIDDGTSITQHAQSIKAAAPHLSSSQAQVQAFQNKLSCCAQAASAATGIPAKFMMGQAALESGWGKHELVAANGQPSHNVFGIKADSNWTGKTVKAVTTEYVNGVATQKVATFRAYDNYHQAFSDYAKLLQGNQRYKNVIASAKDAYGFAQGLQKAGYATDPEYANKLMRVIGKNISV